MKLKTLLLAFFVCVFSAYAKDPVKPEYLKINDSTYCYKLENGLTLFIAENHSVPLAYIEIAVRAGGITQTKDNAGLFHLYEHMMFKGNKKFKNSGAVQKALSDMGTASWNGTTGIECVNYFFTIPKGELENGLDFWNNAIRFPLMDKEEFEVEKKVVISEIQGNVSDPDRYISVYAQKKLFPKAPWQLDPSGSVKNVENATVEQLKEIQKHYYIPENAALFVGGDVSHEEVFELVKKIYGSWTNNGVSIKEIEDVTVHQSDEPFDKPFYCVIPYEKIPPQFAHVDIMYRGPDSDFDEKGTYPADLLTFHLRNPDGKVIKDLLSDKTLKIPSVYDLSVGYSTRRRTGIISFGASMAGAETKIADRTVYLKEKIDGILNSFLEDECIVDEESKKGIIRRLEDDRVLESETFKGMLSTLRYNWVSNNIDYYMNYVKNVSEADDEDIRQLLKRYLKNKNPMIALIINPAVYEKCRADFDRLGFVEVKAEDAFWWNEE